MHLWAVCVVPNFCPAVIIAEKPEIAARVVIDILVRDACIGGDFLKIVSAVDTPEVEKAGTDGICGAIMQQPMHIVQRPSKYAWLPLIVMLPAGQFSAQSPQPVHALRFAWISGPLTHAPTHCSRNNHEKKTVNGL